MTTELRKDDTERDETENELALSCEDCNELVRVEKRPLVGLLMTCGCDRQFSIKTAVALPDGWSA